MTSNIREELREAMRDVTDIYDENFLMNVIGIRKESTGCRNTADYLEIFRHNTDEQKFFRALLSVNYTDFFRNPVAISYLKSIILPHLILDKLNHNKKLIRIWAAGCSTGQEAFSMAFLLEDLKPVIARPFSWMIFATDNQPENIRKANAALYSDEEMENLTHGHSRKYFTRESSGFRVKKEITDRISFSLFDLLDDASPTPASAIFGNFDIIICANLMMYYRTEIRENIRNTLGRALDAQGYLIVGESEHDSITSSLFQEVYPQSFIFRKIHKL